MMVEWVVRMHGNPATGVRSPKGWPRFLSSLLFPVKVIVYRIYSNRRRGAYSRAAPI